MRARGRGGVGQSSVKVYPPCDTGPFQASSLSPRSQPPDTRVDVANGTMPCPTLSPKIALTHGSTSLVTLEQEDPSSTNMLSPHLLSMPMPLTDAGEHHDPLISKLVSRSHPMSGRSASRCSRAGQRANLDQRASWSYKYSCIQYGTFCAPYNGRTIHALALLVFPICMLACSPRPCSHHVLHGRG